MMISGLRELLGGDCISVSEIRSIKALGERFDFDEFL